MIESEERVRRAAVDPSLKQQVVVETIEAVRRAIHHARRAEVKEGGSQAPNPWACLQPGVPARSPNVVRAEREAGKDYE